MIDADQRSEAWFQARVGRLTGTAAAAMLATIKSGEAAARRDLRTRLVIERITQTSQEDDFVNADMRRGIELEEDALAAYMAQSGLWVDRVGFVQHDELPIGYSPDGVIGDFDGLLELKCPRSANHWKNLRAGTVPSEYLPQLTHGLYCTGAAFIDFGSFDPRFPESLRLFVVRLKREDVDLTAYDRTLRAFLSEVQDEYQAIQTMADLRGQLTASVV